MELPKEPPREAVRQADGSYALELEDGSSVRWTRRPDGSWRKPERKRAGWVGELEQKKYVSPGQVQADRIREEYGRTRSAIPGLPPGYAEAAVEAKKNNRNERRKESRKEKSEAREIERHANAPSLFDPQARASSGSDQRDKNPKAIEKKLRQVAELEERQAKGEKLNADQLAKLAAKTDLETELAKLRISDGDDSEAAPQRAAAPVPDSWEDPEPAKSAAPVAAVAAAPSAATAAAPAEAKTLSKKAIEKKLRQIAELEERQARGDKLNEDQLAKLASKDELQAALADAE